MKSTTDTILLCLLAAHGVITPFTLCTTSPVHIPGWVHFKGRTGNGYLIRTVRSSLQYLVTEYIIQLNCTADLAIEESICSCIPEKAGSILRYQAMDGRKYTNSQMSLFTHLQDSILDADMFYIRRCR